MDGAASDLRTGLPWQMVEIHEPVRSLFIIETTPEAMLGDHGPQRRRIGRLVRNGWVQLAVARPRLAGRSASSATARSSAYRAAGRATCRRPPSSVDWYRGWRDHLEFAEIGA